MQRGYTTIDEVVNDFQLMIDDTSYDKDAQIYQLRLLALQGLRELKFDAEQVVKTYDFTVSSSLSVILPSDYIDLNRVGFLDNKNNFIPLSKNPNLNIHHNDSAKINYSSSVDESNPYYHTDLGKKYGVGGGQNELGYYRINRNDNVIHFSSNLKGKVLQLEYVSDGIGEIQPKDHIVRLTFNDGDNIIEGGIKHKSILAIPSSTKKGGADTYMFELNDELFDDKGFGSQIPLRAQGTRVDSDKAEIAKAFCNVVNNGSKNTGQRFNSSPPERLKAIDLGSGSVNLVYSSVDYFSFVPSSLNDTSKGSGNTSVNLNIFDFNTNYGRTGQVSNTKVLTNITLVQQGVEGNTPRVHNFCEEALRCYVYYKYIQRKRGVPASEKQMAKRAYYNEKRLARARMMNFGKEEAMQVSRKAFKQSPKI